MLATWDAIEIGQVEGGLAEILERGIGGENPKVGMPVRRLKDAVAKFLGRDITAIVWAGYALLLAESMAKNDC